MALCCVCERRYRTPRASGPAQEGSAEESRYLRARGESPLEKTAARHVSKPLGGGNVNEGEKILEKLDMGG